MSAAELWAYVQERRGQDTDVEALFNVLRAEHLQGYKQDQKVAMEAATLEMDRRIQAAQEATKAAKDEEAVLSSSLDRLTAENSSLSSNVANLTHMLKTQEEDFLATLTKAWNSNKTL